MTTTTTTTTDNKIVPQGSDSFIFVGTDGVREKRGTMLIRKPRDTGPLKYLSLMCQTNEGRGVMAVLLILMVCFV